MENKKTIWIVIGVIVLIAIALLVWKMKATPVVTDPTPIAGETPVDGTQDVEQGTAPTTAGAVAPVTMSYQAALTKYADRRLQINSECQSFPNTVTYKDNTGIMIDNRSSKTITVKVGTTFTIKPYGFKIVVLPDIYLKTKTLLVDCDKMQNVATVLVQE